MKQILSLKILMVILSISSNTLFADEPTKKIRTLEEMSPEEFKAALKQSHSEIESRLGSSSEAELVLSKNTAPPKDKLFSLSEKRSYETSVQSRINLLDYKIRKLESAGNKNWGYSRNDAAKIRSIQSEARDQLIRIQSDNTAGWKTNKQILESLLREASRY